MFNYLQALGAGTVDAFDNELQEAPEEEDFDGFNDETFGASCPGGEVTVRLFLSINMTHDIYVCARKKERERHCYGCIVRALVLIYHLENENR